MRGTIGTTGRLREPRDRIHRILNANVIYEQGVIACLE